MCQHAAPNHSPASCYYRIHEPRPSPFPIKQKNKYDHYKWHLETRHASGQSKLLKLAHFLRLCNAILNYCVWASPTYPNLAVKNNPKTIVLLLSQSAKKTTKKNFHSYRFPCSTQWRASRVLSWCHAAIWPQSCVLLTERQNHVPACLDWPWEGEAG